jgi:hypothetical protein
MATQFEGAGSFLANSAISAFRGVTLSTNRGIGASATAVVPLGITQQDADSGNMVAVKFLHDSGTYRISITGCPVTAGDVIFAGANGQATRTGGTVTIGRALESASTNGSIIEAALLLL